MGQAREIKAQSSVEYITTYGWAIIIVAIVLAALYALGVFNPGNFVSTTCVFPAEFGCTTAVLSSANGVATITLQQSTSSTISITAYGCNNVGTPSNMIVPASPYNVPIGGTNTLNIQCYNNYTALNIGPGQVFKGFIVINYTNTASGFPHTTTGTLVAKAV